MASNTVTITIRGHHRPFRLGATLGQSLIDIADLQAHEQLLLDVNTDVDIPVAPGDAMIISGGEVFVVGDGSPVVEDNPRVLRPVRFQINGVEVPTETLFDRAKATGSQLKDSIGAAGGDLWADLDGFADEPIGDDQRIILTAGLKFIVIPPTQDDRFYEVTVITDGRPKERRFPAQMTVLEATRRSLAADDRESVSLFQMVDSNLGLDALAPTMTLKDAGVRDGHVLSVTKKDGGGGTA